MKNKIKSFDEELEVIVSKIVSKSVDGIYTKQFNTKDLKLYQYNKDIKDLDWYSPNTDPSFNYFFKELNKKVDDCLYWFELESNKKAEALNSLINDYRLKKGQVDYRVVPAGNKNQNSKILYVGIRQGGNKARAGLTNIVGRITNI